MPSTLATTSRRVLVTGAASGLGLALVRRFAALGDRVLATDLAAEPPAPDSPNALPAGTAYLRMDVRSEADWHAARDWVQDTWGGLDVLVNNAGIAAGGQIELITEDEWELIVDINLLGVARGCRVFTPMFKSQHSGHIVNIASMAGLVHGPRMASYNATKAGVVALSETLTHELHTDGIAVSVVCPYFFQSNLVSTFVGSDARARAMATKLVSGSSVSADQIAGRILDGVDARRDVILTDRAGAIGWYAKRLARPVYRMALTVNGPFSQIQRRLGLG